MGGAGHLEPLSLRGLGRSSVERALRGYMGACIRKWGGRGNWLGCSVPKNWGLWVRASAGSSAMHRGGAAEAESVLAGGRWAGRARSSRTLTLPLDFDGVSSLRPRCLEPCPGQLQSPWGLQCSDLLSSCGGGGGVQPQVWAMEGRVGWLPKACEECLWRSLKLKSLVVPELALEQADNLSLGAKLCGHPQPVPCLFAGPGQQSQTPPCVPHLEAGPKPEPIPHAPMNHLMTSHPLTSTPYPLRGTTSNAY